MLARFMFAIVDFAARKDFGAPQISLSPSGDVAVCAKNRARQSGIRGESLPPARPTPEAAVNWEKRRNFSRVAGQFLLARPIERAACHFDVPAIEMPRGKNPVVCLHKGAFNAGQHQNPIGR